MDDLAALRDIDLDKLAKNQPKTTDPGDVTVGDPLAHHLQSGRHQRRHQRADQQRAWPPAAGSLNGIRTAQVKDPTLATGNQGTHPRGRQRQGLAQRR